jgi:hypothetical protein
MSDNKKPATKVRLHPVVASIFRNDTPKGIAYAVTFERTYIDAAGKWQSSTNFNTSELLLVAKVADLAHSEIYKLRVADRNGDQSQEEAA